MTGLICLPLLSTGFSHIFYLKYSETEIFIKNASLSIFPLCSTPRYLKLSTFSGAGKTKQNEKKIFFMGYKLRTKAQKLLSTDF